MNEKPEVYRYFKHITTMSLQRSEKDTNNKIVEKNATLLVIYEIRRIEKNFDLPSLLLIT